MSDPIVVIQDASPPPILVVKGSEVPNIVVGGAPQPAITIENGLPTPVIVVQAPLVPQRVVAVAQQGPIGPQGPVGPAGQSSVATVTLGATFATNQPYRVEGGVAVVVTSLDATPAFVDGIMLESGSSGDVRPGATVAQDTYATPLTLPSGVLYFLGQNGKLTSTVPTSSAGDSWLVILARQVDSLHFIFSPTQPLAL